MSDDVGARNEHVQSCGCSLYAECVCPEDGDRQGDEIAEAMNAVRNVMMEQGVDVPYAARIRDFTDDAGNVDREALRVADEIAERANDVFVRRLVLAAQGQASTDGRVTRPCHPDLNSDPR